MATLQKLNDRGVGKFPGLLGIGFTRTDGTEIDAGHPAARDIAPAPCGPPQLAARLRRPAAAG